MRAEVVVREVATGLRRNLTMSVAMLLTTAISLGLVGTGLLAVRIIDRTEELYSARVEVQVALTSDLSARDTDCSLPACAALYQRLSAVPGVVAVRFVNQNSFAIASERKSLGCSLIDISLYERYRGTFTIDRWP